MNRTELKERLNEVFRDVFDDSRIIVNENTTSDDIEDWDSLEHINLIGAVEQEFRAAGYGAELSNDQPVAVDRIVIQHVVAFEIDGVGREIVVDRPLPHLDIRVADDLFQIDRLPVPLAGIYLIFHLFSILCWVKSP